MSYKPVAGDILEARIITHEPGPPPQVGINRVRYVVGSIVGAGVQDSDIAITLDLRIAAAYKVLLGNRANYRGVMLQKIYPLPRTFRAITTASAGAGTAGADLAPTQVSGLIKANSARAGRAFRGRVYIPFPASADVTSVGGVSVGYINNLVSLAPLLFTAFTSIVGVNATSVFPVIFHPKGYGRPPIGVNTYDAITDSGASTLWATERRRGNYGRGNTSPPI